MTFRPFREQVLQIINDTRLGAGLPPIVKAERDNQRSTG